ARRVLSGAWRLSPSPVGARTLGLRGDRDNPRGRERALPAPPFDPLARDLPEGGVRRTPPAVGDSPRRRARGHLGARGHALSRGARRASVLGARDQSRPAPGVQPPGRARGPSPLTRGG